MVRNSVSEMQSYTKYILRYILTRTILTKFIGNYGFYSFTSPILRAFSISRRINGSRSFST